MNLFFVIQKYLDRLEDYKFTHVWEKRFMNKLSNIVLGLFFLYLFIVIGIGYVISVQLGFLFALLMMGSIALVLGYYLVVHFITFLAKNNERYLRVMMNQNENTINYDNVVN